MLAGKYRVERLVSSNGMTGVLHARHEEAEQRVVLKYLLPEVCTFPDIVARFLRGARAALQIRSEHAARILDVGRLESGAPYFAMEYLRGWALSEVIRVRGPLPVPDAVDYVVQACEAVAEAHVLGFAHRNLNMSTVLLTRRPDHSALIKVLDFGASDSLVVDPYGDDSPMVDSKAFLESLPYTSPEQIRNTNDIDARADVWAIGTILHELLAGSAALSRRHCAGIDGDDRRRSGAADQRHAARRTAGSRSADLAMRREGSERAVLQRRRARHGAPAVRSRRRAAGSRSDFADGGPQHPSAASSQPHPSPRAPAAATEGPHAAPAAASQDYASAPRALDSDRARGHWHPGWRGVGRDRGLEGRAEKFRLRLRR